jgi:hypothetical protein
MTIALTSWEPDILTKIPIIPHPAFLKSVRDAAIKFCEKTLPWKEWLTAINIAALDRDYALALPVGPAVYGQIDSVRRVLYKEHGAANDQFAPLTPTTEEEMDIDLGVAWQYATASSPSRFLVDEDDPLTLLLYPIPEDASTGGLMVQVYCKPLATATVVPDFLFNRYREGVAWGALAMLFDQKAMPWFDAKMSAYYRDLFDNECDNATVRSVKGAVEKQDRSVQFRRNWI